MADTTAIFTKHVGIGWVGGGVVGPKEGRGGGLFTVKFFH